MIFGVMRTSLGKPKTAEVRILCDSGASKSIIKSDLVKKLRVKRDSHTRWKTAAGNFDTNATAKVQFKMPEFHETTAVEWTFHVTKQPLGYDIILGRDLLEELGVTIDFKTLTLTWDDVSVPMKDVNSFPRDQGAFHIQESESREDSMAKILDAKYKPANLDQIVEDIDHLSTEEKQKLHQLLTEYESLFDGTLGHWKDANYNVELKADATPYHARPYPIPKAYKATLRLEIERLVKAGVLKKVNHSEWGAPMFISPKKDRTVRFISDFRELNKRIKRKPYPLPKIQNMLLKLEGFQYATSLDLNMGYYPIELSPFSKCLCTIVLPFGKYEYQCLPLGLCNSPDIFQEKMSELMVGLDYVRTISMTSYA